MKVIGFGHRQRVGKDTAAKAIFSHVRCNYPQISISRCSFGDQIKEIALTMYGWAGLRDGIHYENHPELKDAILPALGKSPRQIWIELGIAGQNIADQTWPEMAFQKLDCDLAVISDVRRLVEVRYIRNFNGLDVKIERQDARISNDACDIQLTQFADWAYVIQNDGTLREFNQKIIELFEEWYNGRIQSKSI